MTPQSVARTSSPLPALRARVSKRLAPGQNGTERLQAEYGNALVCVRYRQDGSKRYTAVELVIAEQPSRHAPHGSKTSSPSPSATRNVN